MRVGCVLVCCALYLGLVAGLEVKEAHQRHHQHQDVVNEGVVFISKEKGGKLYTFKKQAIPAEKTKKMVAWGSFQDKIMTTGWGILDLETSKKHTDLEQAFGGGFVEGALTATRIWHLWQFIKRSHANEEVYKYFLAQDKFLRSKVGTVEEDGVSHRDHYWFNVALILAQFDGLLDGYNAVMPAEKKLKREELWLLNSDGDILDVERALSAKHKTAEPRFKSVDEMTETELVELVMVHGRCSAFVKFTGDDLLVGHSTWDDYSEMYRVYKHYAFHFNNPSVISHKSSHSSYPGMVSSSDDFYILDSKLVVVETTLNILTEKLFELCDPAATVIAWVRNLVANRMASSAKQWTKIFAEHNSGTYNDQWMILDFNLFKKGEKKVAPHTFYLVEQIPGYTETKDMSSVLEKESYWGSYNRPFFEEVAKQSDYSKFDKKHGAMFSYKSCPRAKIFQAQQASITKIEDMKRLMTYNKWKDDPNSGGCPGNAIAARFDLQAPTCVMSRVANGATDAKVTHAAWVPHLKSTAISGPTHADQKPFSFADPQWSGEHHEHLPVVWDFDWVEMKPKHL